METQRSFFERKTSAFAPKRQRARSPRRRRATTEAVQIANPYMLYYIERFPVLREQCDSNVTAVAALVAQEWARLSESKKATYKKQAEQAHSERDGVQFFTKPSVTLPKRGTSKPSSKPGTSDEGDGVESTSADTHPKTVPNVADRGVAVDANGDEEASAPPVIPTENPSAPDTAGITATTPDGTAAATDVVPNIAHGTDDAPSSTPQATDDGRHSPTKPT